MDDHKGASTATASTANSSKKSKRRNRKKKPTPASTESAAVAAPIAPIAAQTPDLKGATTQLLEEIKKVIDIVPVRRADTMESLPKDRDHVMAEREAKKLAKQTKKSGEEISINGHSIPTDATSGNSAEIVEPVISDRDQVLREREMKKLLKKAKASNKHNLPEALLTSDNKPSTIAPALTEVSEKLESLNISKPEKEETGKPQLTKAERRAIQEAQRAAKAETQAKKVTELASKAKPKLETVTTTGSIERKVSPKPKKKPTETVKKSTVHRVKLFDHLYLDQKPIEELVAEMDHDKVHPEFIRLGVQQAKHTVIGSNARVVAFLSALKSVIKCFKTPPQTIFSRSLEALIQSSMVFVQKCRPVSVSMRNALTAVKAQINHLSDNESDEEHKETLCEFIDTYVRDQIGKAAQAISDKMQAKILNGDVILTYGCSSLIKHILDEASRRPIDFRVIVVDSRPLNEGQEMLRFLTAKRIRCSCVLIGAVSYIMSDVTMVLTGAHALLANGYVMSRIGTAQVALLAKSYDVPFLVCCETHKFSDRAQMDAFVYNEIGDPNDLIVEHDEMSDDASLKGWQRLPQLTPLNLYYDVTPPELVTAVVNEVAILPCTSVPVILRIRPTDVC